MPCRFSFNFPRNLIKTLATASLSFFLSTTGHAKTDASLPLSLHYTHGKDIDVHLNLTCAINQESSVTAPVSTTSEIKFPRWRIVVKPLSLNGDEIQVEVKVLEHGRTVVAPRVTLTLGESASLTSIDPNGGKMNLELKTQNSDGLPPVKEFRYRPRYISPEAAAAHTNNITDPIEKIDLRVSVSHDDKTVFYVTTDEDFQVIRHRLDEVDVAH